VAGKGGRKLFGHSQSLNKGGVICNIKFAAEEFWDDVMNVEDDFSASPLGIPCGEDKKVGNIVNVDKVVALPGVSAGNPGRRRKEETQQGPEIRQL
jgi:hypothetical protein